MALLTGFNRIKSFALAFALVLSWELFARLILPRYEPNAAMLLPPPSAGVADAIRLLQEGTLASDILASVRRVYVGFAFAMLFGIPLGVVMGLSTIAFRQFGPIVGILRPIPPVAWIPITLLWFGVTDSQQYFIIFIGTIFPLVLNTIAGVHDVDPVHRRAALSLGAGHLAMFKMMLWAALPSIFLGVRTALGLGWFIIIASEMVSASTGLGFLIIEARTAMITERMYVGMFAIGVIGLLQDRVLLAFERKLIPWK